jgi:hypothetical protein
MRLPSPGTGRVSPRIALGLRCCHACARVLAYVRILLSSLYETYDLVEALTQLRALVNASTGPAQLGRVWTRSQLVSLHVKRFLFRYLKNCAERSSCTAFRSGRGVAYWLRVSDLNGRSCFVPFKVLVSLFTLCVSSTATVR